MGLDMYLTGKEYFFRDDERKKELQKLANVPFDTNTIEFEVGYWRKANAIHQWFVDTVQEGNDDCGTYYVSEEQLKELLEKCRETLTVKDPSKLLPTQSGFFFGGTEYDESYKGDLNNTIKIIETFINFKNHGKYDLYYHSSW